MRFFVTTSFRDMQNLLDRFKATSRLSARRRTSKLSAKLDVVRQAEANGNDERAVKQLTAFKTLVNDAALVTDTDVRDTLVRDADAMIVRLGGTASKAGVRANDGKPVDRRRPARRGPHPDSPRVVSSDSTGPSRSPGRDGPTLRTEGPRLMRLIHRAAAGLAGLLLAILPVTAPAWAHDGKLKLQVAGDGATGVTVQAGYADGHPVEELIRLVVTATAEGGRTVGPVQLEPAGEGQGFYATGPILAPGNWRVTVRAPAPHTSEVTVQVQARAAQTAPAQPAATPAAAESSWPWWQIGLGVLAASALAAVVIPASRRRRRAMPCQADRFSCAATTVPAAPRRRGVSPERDRNLTPTWNKNRQVGRTGPRPVRPADSAARIHNCHVKRMAGSP